MGKSKKGDADDAKITTKSEKDAKSELSKDKSASKLSDTSDKKDDPKSKGKDKDKGDKGKDKDKDKTKDDDDSGTEKDKDGKDKKGKDKKGKGKDKDKDGDDKDKGKGGKDKEKDKDIFVDSDQDDSDEENFVNFLETIKRIKQKAEDERRAREDRKRLRKEEKKRQKQVELDLRNGIVRTPEEIEAMRLADEEAERQRKLEETTVLDPRNWHDTMIPELCCVPTGAGMSTTCWCISMTLCPCFTAGFVHGKVNPDNTAGVGAIGAVYIFASLFCFHTCMFKKLRRKYREKHAIIGSGEDDCLKSMFCCCLTAPQMLRDYEEEQKLLVPELEDPWEKELVSLGLAKRKKKKSANERRRRKVAPEEVDEFGFSLTGEDIYMSKISRDVLREQDEIKKAEELLQQINIRTESNEAREIIAHVIPVSSSTGITDDTRSVITTTTAASTPSAAAPVTPRRKSIPK